MPMMYRSPAMARMRWQISTMKRIRFSRDPPYWFSPVRRGVLPLDGLVVSRSLRRSCGRFELRVDSAFDAVVEIRPKVNVGGYESLRVPVPSIDVADEDIDAQVERLRAAHLAHHNPRRLQPHAGAQAIEHRHRPHRA